MREEPEERERKERNPENDDVSASSPTIIAASAAVSSSSSSSTASLPPPLRCRLACLVLLLGLGLLRVRSRGVSLIACLVNGARLLVLVAWILKFCMLRNACHVLLVLKPSRAKSRKLRLSCCSVHTGLLSLLRSRCHTAASNSINFPFFHCLAFTYFMLYLKYSRVCTKCDEAANLRGRSLTRLLFRFLFFPSLSHFIFFSCPLVDGQRVLVDSGEILFRLRSGSELVDTILKIECVKR